MSTDKSYSSISGQKESRIAFKEWASVVNALGQGKQVLILRKGGIREEGGEFQIEYDEFFLFPTYEHQNKSDLKPEIHKDFEESLIKKPASELPIRYYVETAGVIHITDEKELSRFWPYHVWSEEAVEKRFHFGRAKGLFVIAVRVFEIPTPHLIRMEPEYSGCKSWVELKRPLSAQGAKPVLSESDFQSRLKLISPALLKS